MYYVSFLTWLVVVSVSANDPLMSYIAGTPLGPGANSESTNTFNNFLQLN